MGILYLQDKCQHYWPVDAEPMFYGDLQVVVLNETKCPEWTVTEFRISEVGVECIYMLKIRGKCVIKVIIP